MPKFLYAKLTIRTFQVEAESAKEAYDLLDDYNSALKLDTPKPEAVKVTSYDLQWTELPEQDPTEGRDRVLAAFLKLMYSIPGLPKQPIPEQKLIILPFDRKVKQ